MSYRDLARTIAIEEGVDPDLFIGLINQESGFNPEARSPKGAIGLAQLMPETARGLGVDPYDPVSNLRGGARYLKQQMNDFGDVSLALAAYNAGPNAVRKYDGIPPYKETQNYVASVLGMPSGDIGARFDQEMRPMTDEEFTQGIYDFSDLQDMFGNRQDERTYNEPLALYDPYEIIRRFQAG